ncbi:hypothetical protein J5N97_018242 [Dioscorea zingiberensis]|uniref:Auxilin-related protein 2 n=1 Tax=Dioscorea zingiberensis TaxID=325984 RepID=A0A9D5HHG0_9LILI|nr:hypothetical protein J5N97_018242 [Dioscorea zingiberensis]
MDEFPGLLARDFGLRPQGKGAPMAPSAGSARSNQAPAFEDVFGGPPRFSQPRSPPSSFDSLFPGLKDPASAPKSSSLPVYDKPVYDDDIFDGVPGMRSSTSGKFDDVFASMGSNEASAPPMEDFLESLGRPAGGSKGSGSGRVGDEKEELTGFEELIPGFGGSSIPQRRESPEASFQSSSVPPSKSPTNAEEDPFVVLETSTSANPSPGLFSDPLEQISRHTSHRSTKINDSSVSGGLFDDIGAFGGLKISAPPFTSGNNDNVKDETLLRNGQNKGHEDPFTGLETQDQFSSETMGNTLPKKSSTDGYQEQNHNFFENRGRSPDPFEDISRSGFQSSDANAKSYERNAKADASPKLDKTLESAEDVWLTVSEIPLFTQPTSAPPPSRAPPPLVIKHAPSRRTDQGGSFSVNSKRNDDKSSGQFSPRFEDSIKNSRASTIDEFEDFAMGKPQMYATDRAEVLYSEDDFDRNSVAAASAAAMKEAMDKAEAKFKHAKEVRERERDARSSRSKETAQERDGGSTLDPWDLGQEKQDRLNSEREEREREEKEREEKRLEKEKELELQREREKARQAVERATREARERAAAEARLKAERAAVEKANAEARQRAERAAVQRAATEARERAAAEARQKAEKAAVEARERASMERATAEARNRAERVAVERATAEARERAASEAREKDARERSAVERAAAEARLRAERAAVERAAAEARERAAAQARDRAAAEARQKQQTNENDLESFFGMGARANSAPKQRAMPSENFFDAQVPRKAPDVAQRPSSTSSTIRKASSATNIVDDLSSIFGAVLSSGEFQEVEGETEERRRARLERHQRTLERAAKALAEKNERDMQTRRDQEERHRIAETLDIEIKRWAAGKEGNLRALLSTLQYVLWPECGWQPVSLTDLITGASVKKVYRKATLCIHPDKVQQKGANLQQKYVAEKVFDLLKEAWNKFNSEELF